MKVDLKPFSPWIGLLFGLVFCCLLSSAFGENPLHVGKILLTGFANSKYDFGLTLFYTTCLIFSAAAFAIPMKAGLFHIGAEGQLTMSAFIAAALGYYLKPLDLFGGTGFLTFATSLFIFAIAACVSALIGCVISAFKFYRQAHEVVVAIMFNFILAATTTWLTVNHFQNAGSQNPETGIIHESLQWALKDPLKTYFDQSPASLFFILAILTAVVLHYLEKKTVWGYQIKAFGQNPAAADRLGLSSKKIMFSVMALAGSLAAFVGITEVFGSTFQYKIGFSPHYGFLGIAVALLARQNFLGIIGSSFLMAALHKGASDLDLETEHLTRDFSRVLQAVIIFSVAGSYYLLNWLAKRRNR